MKCDSHNPIKEFLNRALYIELCLHAGFDLGSTIQSKTKGIWVWCRPHPKNAGQCLLLLDTEGLGDVEKVGFRRLPIHDYTAS